MEAKYRGQATLNTLSNGVKQMSDDWILGDDRLIRAVGEAKAQDILREGYIRLLAETAPDGTTVFKELDAMGKEIGSFIP